MFAPTKEQIEFANKVMEAKKEADEKGVGAIEVEGKMIDEPVFSPLAPKIPYFPASLVQYVIRDFEDEVS